MSAEHFLNGRVALVTGGGRGIGAAIVRALCSAGARVAIADNGTSIGGIGDDPGVALALQAELGQAAVAYTESIATPSGARGAVEAALAAFGRIDIVVTCAAILRDAFIFKAAADDFDAVMRTNLAGTFYTIAAAAPHLRENAKMWRGGATYSWGRLVTITSSAGLYGNYGQAAYAAAKAGLLGLTRAAALDLARSGVCCNAVAPFAATRVTEAIVAHSEAQAAYKAGALLVEAEGVGRFIAYLASDRAQGITGQLFGVRGREVFLFSQPRPVARAVLEPGAESPESYGVLIEREFTPHLAKLQTDLEAFSSPPIV